jgi:cyclin-dependent kinase 7
MAVSPMVLHPSDALQNITARPASSPLKNVHSAVASSNGTPATTVAPNASAAIQSASLDLAEQLNEEEKRKYVKGMCTRQTCPFSTRSSSHNRQEAR